jgi:mono/diheme cytochrome c family protein
MPRFIGQTVIALTLASFALTLSLPARADDASAKLYQSKCVACHGADGTGNTPAGKTLKVTAFSDPDVQKESDADITAIVAKGKKKCLPTRSPQAREIGARRLRSRNRKEMS